MCPPLFRQSQTCTNNPYSERWDTWAATLWLLAGITAFTTVFIFFLLPETLYTNILYRRARRLRIQNGNPAYQIQADIDIPKGNLVTRIIKQTIDDFKLSCMDPVVLFVNMHTMLIYGVLYLWFEFFPFGKSFPIPKQTMCTCTASLQPTFPQFSTGFTISLLFSKDVSASSRKLSILLSNHSSSSRILWHCRWCGSVCLWIYTMVIFLLPATSRKIKGSP